MRLKICFILLLSMGILLIPFFASADLMEYTHAAKGFTISSSRGLSLPSKELEAHQAKALTFGIELSPNVLQLRIPFGFYEVDTQGNLLPQGRVRAESMGASLWLGFGGERWTPFIGAGGSFYTFQEQFKSMGNLENSFGVELYAGIRFRLIKSLWDYAKLQGIVYYHGTLLEPGIQVPEHMDRSKISMHRHSIMLALEVVGL